MLCKRSLHSKLTVNAQQMVLFGAVCIRKKEKGESEIDSCAVMITPKGTEKADVSPSLVMDWLCDLGQVTLQC